MSVAASVSVSTSQVSRTHGLFPNATERVSRWWVVVVGGGGFRMRQILVKMGYAHHGHVVLVNRDDFSRVGHMAPKTKEMAKKAMCAQAMQAHRTCLLLIDAERNMKGKGSWEKRHKALLDLSCR